MTSVGVMASSVNVGGGAFPVVATSSTEVGTILGTANAIPSPSGITAGDLLLATVANDGTGATLSTSTGWSQVDQFQDTSANPHAAGIFARVADGGANDALAMTGASNDYCVSILRITGHGVTTPATDIKFARVVVTSLGTAPNPPLLDAGTSRKWLWVVAVMSDPNNSAQAGGTLTGYTAPHAGLQGGTTSGAVLIVFYRTAEQQTEDPAALGSVVGLPNITYTIAIPPA